jgi:hypothetical protein
LRIALYLLHNVPIKFMRTLLAILALLPVAFAQNELTSQEKKDGFQLLFDGKTLDNWQIIKRRPNDSTWTVESGILSYQKGESWLATKDTYYDFLLRLEYRTAEKTDSGIFVNAGAAGNPGATGVEINLISDNGKPASPRSSGALWDIAAPAENMNKPDGEWNTIEVSVHDRHLTTTWNGKPGLDVNLDDPQYPKLAGRGAYGHIGLQAHAFGEPAAFRNVRIKIIKKGPPDPPAGAADKQ